MIVHTLQFVRNEINSSLPNNGPKVELGNIARYSDGDEFAPGLQNKILLSVINVEEDTVVRQVEHFKKADNHILFANPPLFLNLTIMFASTHTSYDSALIAMEAVVLFFQRNAYYAAASSASLQAFNQQQNVNIDKLTFEMVNLSLDRLHQLWSGLGGHYMPSVIYKMRMLQLDSTTPTIGEPIKEIRMDVWHKKS